MSRPLRVAVLTPWISRNGGGVSESARALTLALASQEGVDCDVFSIYDDHSKADLDGWSGVPVHLHKAYGPESYKFSPGLIWAILKSDADVVHIHGLWMSHCLAAYIWSIIRRKPYFVTPHGMLEPWILRRSKTLKALVSLFYQNQLLRNATSIQVLTEKERGDVRPFAPRTSLSLIPNFVSTVRSKARPKWWKDSFDDKDVYLFLGRIHDKKGWRELCAAWERVCQRSEEFRARSHLVFCGWLDGAADFQEIVSDLTLRWRNATFVGPQFGEDKLATLAAADAFLLPSKSEGLPMVVLEAWAAGVPTLITEECNLPTAFEAGASLRIGSDTESIACGLIAFHELSSVERQSVAIRAKQLLDRSFSRDSVLEKVLNMYDSR